MQKLISEDVERAIFKESVGDTISSFLHNRNQELNPKEVFYTLESSLLKEIYEETSNEILH